MKALIFLGLVSSLMILSCKTVDLEPRNEVVAEKEPELTESELRNMEIELRVDELMKENDLEPTFIVVEEPRVYELSSLPEEKGLSGT